MQLKKLSDRSENIVKNIAYQLSKKGEVREGRLWAPIPAKYFSKKFKLTEQTIIIHLNKLRSEGILISKQFKLKEGNPTNYYTIDLEVISAPKFKDFFCVSLLKKIQSTYINTGFNTPTVYVLNPVTSLERNQELDCRQSALHSLEASNASLAPRTKTTTAQDMLEIWNTEFSLSDTLNKRVSRFLVACYQRVFQSLEKWREYVKSLKTSKYIRDKMLKLKHFLSWALSFKVIDYVKNGGFGVKLGDLLNNGDSGDRYSVDCKAKDSKKQGNESMKKNTPITDDRFSRFFDDKIKKYKGDERAINLLRSFADLYGDYKFYEVFRHADVHLRGSKLRIYFQDNFNLSRFKRPGEYEKFKEYCNKTYDFEAELDPYYDESCFSNVFDVKQMKIMNS